MDAKRRNHGVMEDLRSKVLDTIGALPLSILDLEVVLRSKNTQFQRDDLRSVVYNLACADRLTITPESRIVIGSRTWN